MTQEIPDKPSWLSDEEWSYILDRDHRQCFRWQACIQNHGFAPCHNHLDTDHRQPRILGGDNSFANIRLACLDWNRGRPTECDAYWQRTGWFDGDFFPRELRDIQLIAGYDQFVDKAVSDVLLNIGDIRHRDTLLGTTTLIPGATGIGKTLLTLSILFGVNHEVQRRSGPGLPRVARVLWLETNTGLRDDIRVELEEEPTKFGLTSRPAVVNIAKSFSTLLRGPENADITVACPQSLWEVDKAGRSTHSDDDVRKVLSMWDTIVIDECDFANEQVKRICQLGSHALKFWATASPMKDGAFLTDCVLITEEAVADYTRAQKLDQCLKKLCPEVVAAAVYEGYDVYYRASREEIHSRVGVGRDYAAFMAAVLTVVTEADNLERRMTREAPDQWYSPHIIVRLERIEEIKALAADLPVMLRRMKDNGRILGEGWNVEAVYQGSKNKVGLGQKSQGRYLHPFMLARNNVGRAVKKSARILLMANIGARGLNNWPIKYVVDTTSITTDTETIQFPIGRPIRWPDHLREWLADDEKADFVTTTVVCLPDALDEKQKAYQKAHHFVLNQQQLLAGEFLTWQDLIDGREPKHTDIDIDPSSTPFTTADKTGIRVGLGEMIEHGEPLDATAAQKVVCTLIPIASGKRRQRALEYADQLINDRDFRQQEVPYGNNVDDLSGVGVIAKLKPETDYDDATLARFVQWDEFYASKRAKWLRELDEGRELIRDAVSDRLRQINEHNYREIERTETLHQVINAVAGELKSELDRYRALAPEADFGSVVRCVRTAAKALFGIPKEMKAEDDGPMDKRPYHVAIQVRYRQKIKDMATGRLAEAGLIPAYSRLHGF